MIGGISLSEKKDVEDYFNYMIEEHKKKNSDIEILEKYIGVKNEILTKDNAENRNYLFHINQSDKYQNVWSVIPGKFTLAFSLAPEFYRKVYKKNPKKFFKTSNENENLSDIISETIWGEVQGRKN